MVVLGFSVFVEFVEQMLKFYLFDQLDIGTNVFSENFVYDFEVYCYLVRFVWCEVLCYDVVGWVEWGILVEFVDAFKFGLVIKVVVLGIVDRFCGEGLFSIIYEVLV